MSITIFQKSSFFKDINSKKDYSYVTIMDTQTMQSFFGMAPVMSISINDSTDTSITKNMQGGFNYASFQDNPSVIQITGFYPIASYSRNNNCKTSSNNTSTVDVFFNKYKASKSNNALKLTIGKQTYNTILINMKRESLQDSKYAGLMGYQMTLIGKRTT